LYDDGKERNGPDYSIGLTFSYPLGNNTALGNLASQKATLSSEQVALIFLNRTVQKEVSVAVDKIKSAARSYKLASESLALLNDVAEETSRKLQLGEATLTDLISVEDSLATGKIERVAALSDYAQALAELRFLTGTLAAGENENLEISSVAFKTLPLAEISGTGNE